MEAEIAAHLASYEPLKDSQGRQPIGRNDYLPERELQTGVGPVAVQVPRARDQDPQGPGGPIQFRSTLLPPFLRRSAAMDELLPWLHQKGKSFPIAAQCGRLLHVWESSRPFPGPKDRVAPCVSGRQSENG